MRNIYVWYFICKTNNFVICLVNAKKVVFILFLSPVLIKMIYNAD